MSWQAEKAQEEASALLSKCRALSQRVATYCNRITGESDSFGVETKSLQQAINAAEKSAKQNQSSDPGAAQEVLTQLKQAKDVMQGLGPGGDLRKFCKPRNPWLLRMLVGDKVNVVAYRADQSVAMKEEYHRFRDRSALIMMCAPLLLFLAMRRADAVGAKPGEYSYKPGIMTGVQVYFMWLAYFYLSLGMRENVLLVNGSHIKPWWIQHHYWSCISSVILLGLPVYSPAVYMFCEYFLLWSCVQAVVMMVQNHYQRRRMYTRIALGKNTAMDVVAGESSGTSGQLLLLYPMLFMLQAAQLAIGVGVAIKTAPSLFMSEGWLDVESQNSDLRGMRGVFLVGAMFAFMGVRNFQNTLATILEKRQYASRMKKSKSRADQLVQSKSS